ncbi:MAG: TIGR01777 family oxidoreductase [Litorilinea sp.]
MHVLITGGSGLIGSALTANLQKSNHEVSILTRNAARAAESTPEGVTLVEWDAKSADGWVEAAATADAIVNLAGEGIADGRWTRERKQRIRQSRLDAGKAVTEAVKAASTKPKVVVQASGIDYYGSQGDTILTEDHGPGTGFLPTICVDWERSSVGVEALGVRRAIIRTGIVLSTEGGAFPKVLLPFKLFAGGPMGSGRQWWPWIHIEDQARAIQFLIENDDAHGPFNLVAPEPLENYAFAQRLGAVMSRPAFVPAPTPALRLALGEMADVLLDSHRVIPKALTDAGFTFSFPNATAAFEDLLK